MEIRKIRDAADARACLAAVDASGMLLRDWARANGVDGRSLHCWRLSLVVGSRATPPRMVELVPTPPAAMPEGRCRYLVHGGAFTVEVDERFDEATLARLLRLVRTC